MILTLVNSVNTEDADLKLFFRELERIAAGKTSQEIYGQALEELWEEFKSAPNFVFEENLEVRIEEDTLKSITEDDIFKQVFNSEKQGDIEITSKYGKSLCLSRA